MDLSNYGYWKYIVTGWKASIGSTFTADLTVTTNILVMVIYYTDGTNDSLTKLTSGTFTITVGAGGNGKTVSFFCVIGYPTSVGTIDNVVLHGFVAA